MAIYVGSATFVMNNRDEIIEICETLANDGNLKVTIKETTKGAVLTGFGALLGGLLAGPVGLAIGGTAASITAAATSKNFKPLVKVIQEMSPEQKEKLALAVQRVLENIQPEDYLSLLSLITRTATLKEAVVQEIGAFLMREMSMRLMQ